MGYFATWEGTIVFKGKPSDDQIKDLEKEFCEADLLEPKYDPENRWSVNLYGSGNYSESGVYEALNALNDIAISGELECAGEDGCLWRISYKDGKWSGEYGTTVYNKDEALKAFPPVPDNERCEFVGQIIDIFEDFLEEKGITISNPEKDETDDDNTAIIYGSDYGYCQNRLEEMMRNWKILKEAE